MSRTTNRLCLLQRQTDDIDELFQWQSDSWDFHYQQLTPGKLGFRNRTVQLGDLRLSLNSYDQRVLCRDAFTDGDLIVAMVVSSVRPARVIGRDVGAGTVLVHQQGREKDYVIEPRTTTLDIAVSAERLATLGWNLSSDLVHDVSPPLVRSCIRAFRELETLAESGVNPKNGTLAGLEHQLLALLQNLLRPWTRHAGNSRHVSSRGDNSFELVKHAQQIIARRCVCEKLAVRELADTLGVSERTLYNAFQHWLGVGPYRYDLIHRLHEFRRALRHGRAQPGKITRAALETGFSHLGQLGQLYRRHFGETPTQTLHRAATGSHHRTCVLVQNK